MTRKFRQNIKITMIFISFKNLESIDATFTLTVCSCHITYAFQSESALYSCVNVKELFVRISREMWSLGDCNWARTHIHLVHKRTLNHLAKLVECSLVECSFMKQVVVGSSPAAATFTCWINLAEAIIR